MKKLLPIVFMFTLLLYGCNTNNNHHERPDNIVERKDNTSENKKPTHENSTDIKKEEPLLRYEELTLENIVALAILGQKKLGKNNDYYIAPTADEFLSGEINQFYMLDPDGKDIQFDEISLLKVENIFTDEPPYPMVGFSIFPSKEAAQIIGIGEEKLVLYGTNGMLSYELALEDTGAEYSIKELYETYKDDPRVIELTNMMKQYNSYDEIPEPREK